jgi:transcriptional regulator with XRE-family HTH domain
MATCQLKPPGFREVSLRIDEPMAHQFGAKLRYLRLERDLSQAELARQLGDIGRAHINNVEVDRRPPSLLLVLRAATLFQVTTDYLMRDTIPTDEATAHGSASPTTQTTLSTSFGAKLRQIRQQHGVSQTELAQRLGLAAHAHISLLERAHHEPSIDLVVALADHFGVSTDYLLWDSTPIE